MDNVTSLPVEDNGRNLRIVEALLFASSEALSADDLASRLAPATDVLALLHELRERYRERGVNLVEVAGKWSFRTAGDLAFLLSRERVETRKPSRAAMETLAIVAYHQPVTRAEIEAVRGVSISKGTLDLLLEAGWVRPRGRRRTPGRPVTYGTTDGFLEHFGLNAIDDLPGVEELKGAGLLDVGAVGGLPLPSLEERLAEDPIEDGDSAPELFPPESDLH
ncbi:MAG: SMC-Scp complex subunit ScpB [Bauldia sp.]